MAINLTANTTQLQIITPGTIFVSEQPSTQMVWLKKSVYSGSVRKSLIGCYSTVTSTAFQFGILDGTNFAVWRLGGSPLVVYPNSSLPINQWVFMVYSWNGVSSRFWVNNILVDTNTNVPQTGNINQVWVNGVPPAGVTELSNDYQVADYRLYNRQLSENELTTIFSLRGKDNIINGLVGRWAFNDGDVGSSVIRAIDISINKNDLLPINTPSYIENNLSFVPGIA